MNKVSGIRNFLSHEEGTFSMQKHEQLVQILKARIFLNYLVIRVMLLKTSKQVVSVDDYRYHTTNKISETFLLGFKNMVLVQVRESYA